MNLLICLQFLKLIFTLLILMQTCNWTLSNLDTNLGIRITFVERFNVELEQLMCRDYVRVEGENGK